MCRVRKVALPFHKAPSNTRRRGASHASAPFLCRRSVVPKRLKWRAARRGEEERGRSRGRGGRDRKREREREKENRGKERGKGGNDREREREREKGKYRARERKESTEREREKGKCRGRERKESTEREREKGKYRGREREREKEDGMVSLAESWAAEQKEGWKNTLFQRSKNALVRCFFGATMSGHGAAKPFMRNDQLCKTQAALNWCWLSVCLFHLKPAGR